MNVIFIYKKSESVRFLNIEDALKQEVVLKKQGYEHISTISPEIVIQNINDILSGEYGSDEKCADILKLIR